MSHPMTPELYEEAAGLVLKLHALLDIYGEDGDDWGDVYESLNCLKAIWSKQRAEERRLEADETPTYSPYLRAAIERAKAL